MSRKGGKSGGSQLAAEGLTLAQIGAAVCYAGIDAGGNDRMVKLLLNNSAMRKAVGETVTTPRWRVVSDSGRTYGFMQAEEASHSAPEVLYALRASRFERHMITSGVTYHLRGVVFKGLTSFESVRYDANQLPVLREPNLEVAVLMRMAIKPEELGFDWVMIAHRIYDPVRKVVFLPVLLNTGALVCWEEKQDMLTGFPVNSGAIVFEERV